MSRRGSPVPLFKSAGTKELKFVHGAFCHLCIAECRFRTPRMRPSCYIWFRIRLSARAFHNHRDIDLFLRGTRRPRVTYYVIITFCLMTDPHVETPAFQWCCREERSTPEKCAGHTAEFEKNFAPESHVQGPRSCASF